MNRPPSWRARELADGYRANAALNQEISEEFIHADADNL
jgi:hypothetical protein